jgi:hypothetical protein
VTQHLRLSLARISLLSILWFSILTPMAMAAKELPETPQQEEINLSNPLSRGFQHITGLNALSAWIASRFVTQQIKSQFEGDIQTTVVPYSAGDLLSGKLHQLKIEGKNLVFRKYLPIQSLKVITRENTPIYVSRDSKTPQLLKPVDVDIEVQITESDLNHFYQEQFHQGQYKQFKLNIPPLGEQTLDFISPEIKLVDNRIEVKGKLNMANSPLENAVPLFAQSELRFDEKNQAIALKNLNLNIEGLEDITDLTRRIEDHFGRVLKLSKIKLRGHQIKLSLQDPQFSKGSITLSGQGRISSKTKNEKAKPTASLPATPATSK